MPPVAAQPAEEEESNPAESAAPEGEEGEQPPTQIHTGTGQNSLTFAIFVSVVFSFMFSVSSVNVSDSVLPSRS